MRLGMGNQARNPDQHAKQDQHERQQTDGKLGAPMNENGDRRQRKRGRGEDRPKIGPSGIHLGTMPAVARK